MPETRNLPPRDRIRGALAPVVTPFKADLSPDLQRFIAHCQWLLSQNCGLAPFGTNSEANSMSTDERISLLDGLHWLLLDHGDSRAHCACNKTWLRRCSDAAAVLL